MSLCCVVVVPDRYSCANTVTCLTVLLTTMWYRVTAQVTNCANSDILFQHWYTERQQVYCTERSSCYLSVTSMKCHTVCVHKCVRLRTTRFIEQIHCVRQQVCSYNRVYCTEGSLLPILSIIAVMGPVKHAVSPHLLTRSNNRKFLSFRFIYLDLACSMIPKDMKFIWTKQNIFPVPANFNCDKWYTPGWQSRKYLLEWQIQMTIGEIQLTVEEI